MCYWSNIKARVMVIGTKSLYQLFFEFSVDESEKYIYLL